MAISFSEFRKKIISESANISNHPSVLNSTDKKTFNDIHKNNKLDKSGTSSAQDYKFEFGHSDSNDHAFGAPNSALVNGHLKHQYDNSYTGMKSKNKPTEIIKSMDTALNKARTDRPMTVYTGIRSKPKTDSNGHAHLPGYTSASLDKSIAHEFAENKADENNSKESHVLRIDLPKGSKAASLDHIKPDKNSAYAHDEYDREHEILMHRGHTIKIHPTPEVTTTPYGMTHHVWHASVVSHNPQHLSEENKKPPMLDTFFGKN